MSLALLGLPSVADVIEKIASAIWGAFADALIPDWIKEASGRFLTWLVNVPNPANAGRMPNIDVLHEHVVWLAIALLGLTTVASAVRFSIGSMTSDQSPATAIVRTLCAALGLILYKWGFQNAIAFVNVMTAQIFTWPIVDRGADALAASIFGSALFSTGPSSPILAIFALIAFALVLVLLATKIAIFVVLTMLYVGGPLAIALSPLPEFSGLARTWVQSVASTLIVPLLWSLMFATAGVLVLDLPKAVGFLSGSGIAGKVGANFISAIAAIIVVYLAMKVGLRGLSQVGNTASAFLSHGSGGTKFSQLASGMAIGEARARVRGSIRTQATQTAGRSAIRRGALAAAAAASGAPSAAGASSASRAASAAETAARRSSAPSAPDPTISRDHGPAGRSEPSTGPAAPKRPSSPAPGPSPQPSPAPPKKRPDAERAHEPGATTPVGAPARVRSANDSAAPAPPASTSRPAHPALPATGASRPNGAPNVAEKTPTPASSPKRRIKDAGEKVQRAGAPAAPARAAESVPAPAPKAPRASRRPAR